METEEPRFEIDKTRIEIVKITRSDLILEECIGPSEDIRKNWILGYLAKVAIPGKRYLTSYALSENDALKSIVEFANSGHLRSSPFRFD